MRDDIMFSRMDLRCSAGQGSCCGPLSGDLEDVIRATKEGSTYELNQTWYKSKYSEHKCDSDNLFGMTMCFICWYE